MKNRKLRLILLFLTFLCLDFQPAQAGPAALCAHFKFVARYQKSSSGNLEWIMRPGTRSPVVLNLESSKGAAISNSFLGTVLQIEAILPTDCVVACKGVFLKLLDVVGPFEIPDKIIEAPVKLKDAACP